MDPSFVRARGGERKREKERERERGRSELSALFLGSYYPIYAQ